MAAVRNRLDYYGAVPHDWRPFRPDETPLSVYASQVIARRGINAFLQPAGRPLCDVLDEAGEANDVVVVLLDAWTAGVSPYRDELRRYDERHEVTAVVMVPRSKDDDEGVTRAGELDMILQTAMPKVMLRRDALFKYGPTTLPAFR